MIILQLRSNRPPKGDPNSTWSHDLYEDPDAPSSRSLSARLTSTPSQPRKADLHLAQRALREATGQGTGISIKGASSGVVGNVVQVEGLVKGTTPADVEAIFKRCGVIISSTFSSSSTPDAVSVRLTFKIPAAASAAIAKFDGQPADGKILKVRIVGGTAASLGGRLGGIGLAKEEGSVDVLMESSEESGSKLRSDSIIASDPRASVLTAPPGTDPKMYNQQLSVQNSSRKWQRGAGSGGGRGRRGGRRGGGVGSSGNGGMDID
ncbi:hypothetical protein SERLA73DRAFT_121346 [Serpula lacrymans var. lacrymans S7.3]|uniref:RRM domain-containing protein n=2 Tax=Serpula lacrymans var. lacrymans TaxID=341189 RepID=F8PTB9_SERL3|nr:uncharacterized protein SERLADRAFT_436378 [Serpula lacrymans var. lacrymans S7.9]EGO00949.1 hypothetical protein SERLA73DRAFT_121346 [Serpula lacrymans var. lacrymans S7.3]EGO26568.1 hypothetical protein SERLADRAFT_436378 [Serpula lacrymans var. lacrymans S7.9]